MQARKVFLLLSTMGAVSMADSLNVDDYGTDTQCTCATVTEIATPVPVVPPTGVPTSDETPPTSIVETTPSVSGVPPIPTIGSSTLTVSVTTVSTSVEVPGTTESTGTATGIATGSETTEVPTQPTESGSTSGPATGTETGTATGTETVSASASETGTSVTGSASQTTPTESGSATPTEPSSTEAPSTSQGAGSLPTGDVSLAALFGGAVLAMVNL